MKNAVKSPELADKKRNNAIRDFESALKDYTDSSKSSSKLGREMGVALTSVAVFAVCTTESEAATMVVDVNAFILSGSGNNVLLDFAINGSGNDFEFTADSDPAYPFIATGARNGIQILGRQVGAYFYASRIQSGNSIGPGGGFLPAGATVNKLLAFSYPASASVGGDWFGGETGFVGFRVPNGPNFNYGWIEVTVNPDSISGTVIRYGIESDVNTAAVAGVPETNSLAYLAMGAAGLLGWRQRRKTA